MSRIKFVVLLFIFILHAFPAMACMWDEDTLAMERQAFPNILEVITGKFLRHSPEFYQWRIEDRLKRLTTNAKQLELYDDLAVAYEKVGQTEKAIDTILKKEGLKPKLYTTYANLGTFYLHNQQWQKGIETLQKAINMNPDAHFGREKYQILLAQYYLTKKDKGLPLGMMAYEGDFYPDDQNFYQFLQSHDERDKKAALKGIMGMMHFGNFRSPVLLEGLGDVLMAEGHLRLATRAYLKASYEVKNSTVAKNYLKLAHLAFSRVDMRGFDKLETQFKQEIQEAEDWYQQVRQDEINWIKAGLNPEEKFKQEYYQEPEIKISGWLDIIEWVKFFAWIIIPLFVLVSIFVIPIFLLRKIKAKLKHSK